jgi:hypothetical protein
VCYSSWYNAPIAKPAGNLEAKFLRFHATGRQHLGCIIPQAVTHKLALLKMVKIIARNMLSCFELLIKCCCCIHLVVYIIFINDARSSKYQIMKYIFLRLVKQSQFIPLQNVVHFITLLFWFVKYSHFT